MEEKFKYKIDDLKALETEVINAQTNYQASDKQKDKIKYEQLLDKFNLLLTKHIIFSTIKAYQYRSEETALLSEELKAKKEAYFGNDFPEIKR